MFLIWFIGMYVIFIIQQITIFYLVCKWNIMETGGNSWKLKRGGKK